MLPLEFVLNMRELLGEDYPAFESALLSGDAVRGTRVNLIKAKELPEIAGAALLPLGYTDNGYILEGDVQIGRTPEHHAGIIYMQDPGAMSALTALDIPHGAWVADLCSAPGGKSSQVAERLGDAGFLLSNEYVPKRAKMMVGNFERLGISRAIVTSYDTEELAELFPSAFDIVIADAPCSGEGMFRKNEEARAEWSLESVAACAERQKKILGAAYRMLRPGGRLLYSTCTWNTTENEGVVADFLDTHPDMSLIPVKPALAAVTSDGVALFGREELKLARRFYPHIAPGEGQFVALMERGGSGERREPSFKENLKKPTRDDEGAVLDFFRENLDTVPEGRLIKVGDGIALIPHACPIPPRGVFMSGVMLGEVKGKILRPAHQLFSVYGRLFKRRLELSDDTRRLSDYLMGREIAAPDVSGYCAVLYRGAPLGGGKASGGTLKNHYPKGLRNPQE